MISVAVVDDHPAVLAGLQRLIDGAHGLVLAFSADGEKTLAKALDQAHADVVVLDYDLGRGNGLVACQRLKEGPDPPAVVLYSAYAGPALAFAARIAGVDALVDKRAPASEVLDAIRAVAAGRRMLPPIPQDNHIAAIERLDAGDVPVAAMILAGTPYAGIAEALATDRRDVIRRARRIVGRLGPRPGRADDGIDRSRRPVLSW